MVSIGSYFGHNDTSFDARLMARFVHPLMQGQLSDGDQVTSNGEFVQWSPVTSFAESEASTYSDGSYRYALMWTPQSITSGSLTEFNVEKETTSEPTFTLHADVAASWGDFPFDPVANVAPSFGSGGSVMPHDCDGISNTLFTASDPDRNSWQTYESGPNAILIGRLWRQNGFVFRMFLEFYRDLPYVGFWYRGGFSDPSSVNLEKVPTLWRLGFRNCEPIIRRESWKLGGPVAAYTYSSQNMQIVSGSTECGDGQMFSLSGWLMHHSGGQPAGDPYDALRAVNSSPFGEVEWCSKNFQQVGYGPRDLNPGLPPWFIDQSDAESEAIAQGQRLREQTLSNPWDHFSNTQTFELPPNPGGKAGDATIPYIAIPVTGVPTILSSLRAGAMQDWIRPAHFHEADAEIVRSDDHLNLVIFQGRPFGGGFGLNDRLGKPVDSSGDYNQDIHGQGGWRPFDKSHYDLQPLLAYAYVSGDPLALDALDHHRELLLSSMKTRAQAQQGTSSSFFVAEFQEERELRGLNSIAWIQKLLPRPDVESQINEHLTSSFLNDAVWQGQNVDSPFGPAASSLSELYNNDPRHTLEKTIRTDNLGPINGSSTGTFIYWQRGFFTNGALNWLAVTSNSRLREVAKRLAYDCVRNCVFNDNGPRFNQSLTQLASNSRYSLMRLIHNYQGQSIPSNYMPPSMGYTTNDGGNIAFTPTEALPTNVVVDSSTGQFPGKTFFQVSDGGSEFVQFPAVLAAYQFATEDGDASDVEQLCLDIINSWFQNNVFGSSGWADPSGSNVQYFIDYQNFFNAFNGQPTTTALPTAHWLTAPWVKYQGGTNEIVQVGMMAGFAQHLGGLDRIEVDVTVNGSVVAQHIITDPDWYYPNDSVGINPLLGDGLSIEHGSPTWCYVANIDVSNIPDNTIAFVTARAYGSDAQGNPRRDFIDNISIHVDRTGNFFTQTRAFVSLAGNDNTGQVGNAQAPYLTIGAAVDGLKAARGSSDISYCEILLQPSQPGVNSFQLFDNNTIFETNSFPLTIKKAVTATRDQISLRVASSNGWRGRNGQSAWLKIENVFCYGRFTATTGSDVKYWFDGIRCEGPGWSDALKEAINATECLANSSVQRAFFTSCDYFQVGEGPGTTTLTRDCRVDRFIKDAYTTALDNRSDICSVNVLSLEQDKFSFSNSAVHSDLFQFSPDGQVEPTNILIMYARSLGPYNFSQGVFQSRPLPKIKDVLIVGMQDNSNRWDISSGADHLMFWHISHHEPTTTSNGGSYSFDVNPDGQDTQGMTNCEIWNSSTVNMRARVGTTNATVAAVQQSFSGSSNNLFEQDSGFQVAYPIGSNSSVGIPAWVDEPNFDYTVTSGPSYQTGAALTRFRLPPELVFGSDPSQPQIGPTANVATGDFSGPGVVNEEQFILPDFTDGNESQVFEPQIFEVGDPPGPQDPKTIIIIRI